MKEDKSVNPVDQQPDEKSSASVYDQKLQQPKKEPTRITQSLLQNTTLPKDLIGIITDYIGYDAYKQSCVRSCAEALRGNVAKIRALSENNSNDKTQLEDLATYIEGLALEIEGSYRILLMSFKPDDLLSPSRRTIYLELRVRGLSSYWYKDQDLFSTSFHLSTKNTEQVLQLLNGRQEIFSSDASFAEIASLCGYCDDEYKKDGFGQDLDFLSKAQTTLRKWKLRHTKTSKTATTAYLLTLGLLYTSIWEGIYTGVNKGDPMAFFDALKDEKVILIVFVVSMVLFVGMAHLLYVVDHRVNRADQHYGYKSRRREDYSDDSMSIIPLRLRSLDPFSIYSQYANVIDNCVEEIEQYRTFIEIEVDKLDNSELSERVKEDLKRKLELHNFLNIKIIELRQMMNDYPFDGCRIRAAIKLLEAIRTRLGSNYMSKLEEQKEEKRGASRISQWLIYPAAQVTFLSLMVGVGIGIAAASKKDPEMFMNIAQDGAYVCLIGMAVGIFVLIPQLWRIHNGVPPPEWADPFSNQEGYTRILEECKNALKAYQTVGQQAAVKEAPSADANEASGKQPLQP